jgi:hypothetical protein
VEVPAGVRVRRDQAGLVEQRRAGRERGPAAPLGLGRRRRALPEHGGQAAVVARQEGGERPHQRLDRRERRAAVHPGVLSGGSGRDADRAVHHPANARRELVDAPVEHHGGRRDASVGEQPPVGRVAADLLLGVDQEAHVHRQGARSGELFDGGEEDHDVRLVVGDATAVELAVTSRQLERRRRPRVGRPGQLHVDVRVDEHVGRRLGRRRGANLADDERRPLGTPRDRHVSADPADPPGHPLGRADHLAGALRVG